MDSRTTRRALLHTGSVLASTTLAGCTFLTGTGNSTDPDAGPDSYGILLRNSTDHSYTATITAWPRGEENLVFEQTTEVSAGGTQEWEQVLTKDGLYRVKAVVDADHFITKDGQNQRTISVGASNSNDVENVLVLLKNRYEDVTTVSAEVTFATRNATR